MATAPLQTLPPLSCRDEEGLGKNPCIPVFRLKVSLSVRGGEGGKAAQLFTGRETSIRFSLKEERGEVLTKQAG